MKWVVFALLAACRLDFNPVVGTGDGAGGDGSRELTVIIVGRGGVTSDPSGITCVDDCTARFTGPVTLTATRAGPNDVSSWTGASCGTTDTCVADGTVDQTITVNFTAPPADANLVFLTSAAMNAALKTAGDTNGLTAGDRICMTAATSAGLSGQYTAFLSSATLTTNAIDRFGSAYGWTRVDGSIVFPTVASIQNYGQLADINLDENGQPVTGGIWLGGNNDGTATVGQNDCTGFTESAASTAFVLPTNFAANNNATASSPCVSTQHLACFESDKQIAVTPPPPFPFGRTLFVTASSWPGTGATGTTGADARCQADATAAGLSGTYVAALATSTTKVSDRVKLGGPWLRPDGSVVTLGPLDSGNPMDLAFDRDATGAVNDHPFFIGALDLDSVSAGTSCSDWTSFTAADTTLDGAPYVFSGWISPSTNLCTVQYHLLCLQT